MLFAIDFYLSLVIYEWQQHDQAPEPNQEWAKVQTLLNRLRFTSPKKKWSLKSKRHELLILWFRGARTD